MKKRDRQIEAVYDNYDSHLKSDKTTVSPFVVSSIKPNHPQSYAAQQYVSSEYPFGNTSIDCEVRNGVPFNYSFSYLSDAVDSKVLVRLDTGDGTHRNRAPGIPLRLSQVPTPHIHKYRSDGYSVAYPIDGVDYSSEASTKFDYQQGFDYFCSGLNIHCVEKTVPQFRYAPDGILVFPMTDNDPNEGADFDTTF